ncbi:MAG: preprotein translocase subunit SecG [Candidatus Moranbacteria bacterium]|nr:preprotein translocase subunit SecG [Candidatus Moranbacteria bacterium]
MIEKILIWAQIAVSVLLAVSILLQNRGAGLSASFGGDFGGYYTKRGMEKFLYWASVFLSAVFLGLAVANIYFSSKGA